MNCSMWAKSLTCMLAATMLLGMGCDKKTTTTPAPGTKDTEQAKSVEAAAAPDSCTQYSKAFCEAVGGDTAQSCTSLKAIETLLPPEACAAGLKNVDFTKEQFANLGKKCTELMEKLCGDLGEDTQTCKMVRTMTPQFPAEQCQMMLGQYDKVLAELKAQEEMTKPLSAEKQAKIAAADAPSFGPADAKVTIVEFSDFECPYCTMAAGVTTQLKEKYGDKVRVVFRQFPLSFHPNAHLASQAALAANEQGKFWEYHDKLFANQKAMTRPDLEKYAQELKLDMKKFNAALDDGTYKAQVDSDMALGQEVTVQGTPTMFLNGERIQNPTAFEGIEEMIKAKLAE